MCRTTFWRNYCSSGRWPRGKAEKKYSGSGPIKSLGDAYKFSSFQVLKCSFDVEFFRFFYCFNYAFFTNSNLIVFCWPPYASIVSCFNAVSMSLLFYVGHLFLVFLVYFIDIMSFFTTVSNFYRFYRYCFHFF